MGVIVERRKEHGAWLLELRRESFYLTADGVFGFENGQDPEPAVAPRVRKDPPAMRVPSGSVPALREALAFVWGSNACTTNLTDTVSEQGVYETRSVGDQVEISGPMHCYGDNWGPAVVEIEYRHLEALIAALP